MGVSIGCFRRKIVGKTLLVALFLITILNSSDGQQSIREGEVPRPIERIYLGGNFGIQIGTFTYIELSPVIGYWLLPRLSIATGPSFKYYKDPYGSSDVWGGKGYTRFVFVNDLGNLLRVGWGTSLFFHAEYEALSFKSEYLGIVDGSQRKTIDTGLAGVGFGQPVGQKGNINFTLLWTVYDSGYQIYSNPEYRIEFNFRF
jgi:hypothetical protein